LSSPSYYPPPPQSGGGGLRRGPSFYRGRIFSLSFLPLQRRGRIKVGVPLLEGRIIVNNVVKLYC